MMKDLPLSKVYRLLEPGPVVLLTTARDGRANVMTMFLAHDGRVRAAAGRLRR